MVPELVPVSPVAGVSVLIEPDEPEAGAIVSDDAAGAVVPELVPAAGVSVLIEPDELESGAIEPEELEDESGAIEPLDESGAIVPDDAAGAVVPELVPAAGVSVDIEPDDELEDASGAAGSWVAGGCTAASSLCQYVVDA